MVKRKSVRKSKSKKKGGKHHVEFEEDLAAETAQQVERLTCRLHQPYLTLRLRQVDWDFHDFYLTVPRESSIYQLQIDIAKHQHGDAVHPNDVLLYTPLSSNANDSIKNKENSLASVKKSPLNNLKSSSLADGPDQESTPITFSNTTSSHPVSIPRMTIEEEGAIKKTSNSVKSSQVSLTGTNRNTLGPVCTDPLMKVWKFVGELDPLYSLPRNDEYEERDKKSPLSQSISPVTRISQYVQEPDQTEEDSSTARESTVEAPEGPLIPLHVWQNKFAPDKTPPTIVLPTVHYAHEFKELPPAMPLKSSPSASFTKGSPIKMPVKTQSMKLDTIKRGTMSILDDMKHSRNSSHPILSCVTMNMVPDLCPFQKEPILILYDIKTYILSIPRPLRSSSAFHGKSISKRNQYTTELKSVEVLPHLESFVDVNNVFDRSCPLLSYF